MDENSQFWTKNPYILFNKNIFFDIFPLETMKLHEKLNALTRLTIYLSIAFYLLFKNINILVTCIVILIVLVFVYYVLDKKSNNYNIKETFTNSDIYDKYIPI